MPIWKRNLFILWVTQVISLMSFGFGIPFIPFYIEELGVNTPEAINLFTGILSTAPAISMAFMAPIWGKLADKYGRKLMILRAMFAAVFVIGGMGLVQNIYALVALRSAQGLFTGTVTAASAFIASNTPKERLSYALGFMASSTFIGYSIGPALGGLVADRFGYRVSFFVGALFMAVGVLLVLLFIKEDPETYGAALKKHKDKHEGKILSSAIVSLLVILFMQRFTRSVFAPYMPLYLKTIHGEDGIATVTGMVNMFVGLATAVAGLSLSRLGDKFKKSKLIVILLGIAFVFSFFVIASGGLIGFMLSYTLLFFILGGIEPMLTSSAAELTSPQNRGTLFGYMGMVGSFGWMVSPMTGAAISVQYGYKAILFILPVLIAFNIAFAIFNHRKQASNM
ncbi:MULTISPECIES: MFS transporter [unclassified Fusibacter]|uniref:MFS transporter n=1 Tax=unclassified Fusibacter TaxID=2624464 RepID=UPI0013E91C7C|nr:MULTISPECIES: MFS transporter [unclassified Fusibacter]MCK8059317.1 MFS transporter [Fusibacter sp. A2]NPE21219.1 MFS transporter [Fusibacter sp. A1]